MEEGWLRTGQGWGTLSRRGFRKEGSRASCCLPSEHVAAASETLSLLSAPMHTPAAQAQRTAPCGSRSATWKKKPLCRWAWLPGSLQCVCLKAPRHCCVSGGEQLWSCGLQGRHHSPGHPASPEDSPDIFVISHQGHGTACGHLQTALEDHALRAF